MELTDIQIPSDLRDCSLTELEVIAQHIRKFNHPLEHHTLAVTLVHL